MPYTTSNLSPTMHVPLKEGWDIDFLRAKFNVSSKEIEKAIQYAGNSREKMIEYFRKFFYRK